MPFVHFVSQADMSRHQGFLSTKQKNNIIQTTTHNTMKTITIGKDTPILTYRMFCSLALKNEIKAKRKAKINRIKARMFFWRKKGA